ncbi:hypothetical protein [Nitrosomonas sp.]|uniref:hypothetical protein n=1 Tax=Nitrosomonas sp. TaxID=42353 RepID=UPI0025DF7CAD|nr:hypothetical protein [Nitrosomonas sp.]MBY0484581.1 hypothetical protein [Nitrosomonas sp.]
MKKSDLYREWARVLDMCDGTKVKPEECWGYMGLKSDGKLEPSFNEPPLENYFFAVAILEDKPVFVGDGIYHKSGLYTVIGINTRIMCISDYSWNPPKKTFLLNGEELPCPISGKARSRLTIHCEFDEIQNEIAYINFHGNFDAKKVLDHLMSVFKENTK